MLGLALGKVGCFLEGCCWGGHTDGPLGVRFPGHALPRHPTQLYEAAVALALAAGLAALGRRATPPGTRLGALLAASGLARLGLEVLRADPRGGLGPLSTSQLLAIPIALAGAALLATRRRRAAGAYSSDATRDRGPGAPGGL
jgi:phosphatidylglycerol:prolipoprotein diacylglycerol transferase